MSTFEEKYGVTREELRARVQQRIREQLAAQSKQAAFKFGLVKHPNAERRAA